MNSKQLPKTDAPFPVVGIAASAGGLEAFTELICHLPTDTGMAFVLIQHLSPNHESLLSEILGRVTQIPVRQVQDLMTVEPNNIYVIPPNTQMTLTDGILHLAQRQKIYGKPMPGDAFFESLAVDRGNKAIAVVLSGMNGDGSQGLKAVKVAGGVTFAQCEATARFDSMPNTAIATGNVDFVLSPQAIALELTNLSRSSFLFDSEQYWVMSESPKPGDALATIFALLRTTTGVDFTSYKPTTLNRRMQRRMLLYKLLRLEDYAQYLQTHPAEVQALYEEILIHVTSFFRNPETFEALKTQVFPTISQNKAADTPIRIWVAGCSTGEEVYSIAICLLEFFSVRVSVPPIQIFATDISEAAINTARSGFYLESQMEGVSLDRRNRFFVPVVSGGYQISRTIRQLCVFARHNLGSDPPFSNLDLISCRNVLIYLSDPLQKRIMSLFNYSLNLTGFLILGTSESIKTASDLFTSVDEPAKIYARSLTLNRPLFSFTTHHYPMKSVNLQQRVTETIANNVDLAREVDQLISNRYAPVSAVINDQMHILHLRGDTDRYLKLPPGSTDLNLLLMAREGLAIALNTAIYQAQTQNISVRQEQIQIESGERSTRLNLEVIPFQPAVANALYFLVIFEAVELVVTPLTSTPDERQKPEDKEREIMQLRQALAAATQRELSAQAHLQAVIQEQSYLNQSLRVANEEILSSNEELQSTNEELQTAKEEIQATNEELSTTNDELRSRNLQQNRDNSDLNNFVDSISVPILMLTNDLRIRRFTPAAQRLFNFIPTDVGRPFNDLRTDFDVFNLEAMTLEVLSTLNTFEQEVQTQAGYWYLLRIRPYRTIENQIDGVTMVFLDIDVLKRHADALEFARNYAELIVETVQIPLVVLDAELRVNTANRAFYEMFQVSASETERSFLSELGNEQWNISQLRAILSDIFINNRQVQDFEVDHCFDRIGQKTMLLNACKLQRDDHTAMILLAISDITDRKQAEIERDRLTQQLYWLASHDTLTELINRRKFEEYLTLVVSHAKLDNQQHALCYLDLDQFKIVNDTCGHVAGDELLKQVTTLLKKQIRQTDTLARLGGDEFGLLLYLCSIEQAQQIADTICEQVQAFRFIWQSKIFTIGVSIGLAAINQETDSVTSILSMADTACYTAKNRGRQRVQVYQADDLNFAQQKGETQWAGRILQALSEDRFRLYYQQIAPLTKVNQDGSEHYEVLLRLEDEMGDIMLPSQFILAAERYSLMHLIDRWVIETLFATQGHYYRDIWQRCQQFVCHSSYLYSINLSGASLNDEHFFQFLHEQFAKYQIPPQIICFEITETVAISNLTKTAKFIQEFRGLGCRFALDDFGSGMCSFSYLKNLPVDYLKIDGGFVENIESDSVSVVIVEAIQKISSAMGIQTIAEFVKNEAILKQIKALGVDYAQGYAIALPFRVPAEIPAKWDTL